MFISGTTAQIHSEENSELTFDYKIAWIDVESATFGVSLQAYKKPTFIHRTNWSLLVRYDASARANITQISQGWGLNYYDYSTWIIVSGKEQFNILRYTVRSSGKMNLEDTVNKLAVPNQLFLINSTDFSDNQPGVNLELGVEYFVNADVNLAQIPKKAFGDWLNLKEIDAEKILSSINEQPPSGLATQQSDADESNVAKSDDVSETTPTRSSSSSRTTATPSTSSKPQASTSLQVSSTTMATVLPLVKFIKGDPNYDPNINVIGTVLSAPRTGLYLVSTILGIGIIAHAAGTYRRFQYKRQYQSLVQRSKSGHLHA
ncbi:hypothetical protein LPJ66_005758 [Kickxella alabastrina]|uniref:Uncharacterized protein n=1 Tax=Kickxella alabastrina TaxID=61397 RepID=A0ACC1IG03_9FUNG|nr:hypothetical protein LPJ66_005758 [Kickxella alabastrina]